MTGQAVDWLTFGDDVNYSNSRLPISRHVNGDKRWPSVLFGSCMYVRLVNRSKVTGTLGKDVWLTISSCLSGWSMPSG